MNASSLSKREVLWERLFVVALPLARRAAEMRSSAQTLERADMDRDDLMQEVLMAVWAALQRYDPGKASLRTFVERVAAAGISSVIRRRSAKMRSKPEDMNLVADSVSLMIALHLRLDLDRLLRKLHPRDRRVALLLMGDSPARVARALGISRAAVYRSIERIRGMLLSGGYE